MRQLNPFQAFFDQFPSSKPPSEENEEWRLKIEDLWISIYLMFIG
jgi:hypothetical protein